MSSQIWSGRMAALDAMYAFRIQCNFTYLGLSDIVVAIGDGGMARVYRAGASCRLSRTSAARTAPLPAVPA